MVTTNFIQLLKNYKVVIPPIQRDYAQGRQSGKIPYIRNRFLDTIFDTLKASEHSVLNLDFIYGSIDNDRGSNTIVFKPLDGQQRLTTIFLLHWFILNKEKPKEENIENIKKILHSFSYATRSSSTKFCNALIGYNSMFNFESISSEIENQSWYYSSWKSDPTIASMLVMLDAIEKKYQDCIDENQNDENYSLWDSLNIENPRIIFHLLPMEDLGLPDDLYIKMNSRGKELTDFEHFKSSFGSILNDENAKVFSNKIDQEWSDLFWDIFKSENSNDVAQKVDKGFLNFFWYITDILIVKNDIKIEDDFWLEKAKQVYKKSKDNVQFLFNCINLFERLQGNNPEYFSKLFYINTENFSTEKTRLFFGKPSINLFHKCAKTYQSGGFVIREQVLLYAIIQIELNNYNTPENFYRLTRNLLEHAADKEIRNENLKNLFAAMDNLIKGERNYKSLPFTQRQLKEEKEKEALIEGTESLKEIVYKLDDHILLRGNIAIFDFDESIENLGKIFIKQIKSENDYISISKALLTFGDYTQKYDKNYRRFGNRNNSVWREIFTQSESREGFNNTKQILKSYLKVFINDSVKTNEDIIDGFLQEYIDDPDKPKELRYYFIKYDSFVKWNGQYTNGYYYFFNHSEPYDCFMMFKTQFNGRHWSPFLLEITNLNNKCTLGNFGDNMQFTNGDLILLVRNTNNGFKFLAPENDDFSECYLNDLINDQKLDSHAKLLINQDNNGVDLEDRIQKCNDFLNQLKN